MGQLGVWQMVSRGQCQQQVGREWYLEGSYRIVMFWLEVMKLALHASAAFIIFGSFVIKVSCNEGWVSKWGSKEDGTQGIDFFRL
jgi:hypothetical protein